MGQNFEFRYFSENINIYLGDFFVGSHKISTIFMGSIVTKMHYLKFLCKFCNFFGVQEITGISVWPISPGIFGGKILCWDRAYVYSEIQSTPPPPPHFFPNLGVHDIQNVFYNCPSKHLALIVWMVWLNHFSSAYSVRLRGERVIRRSVSLL